MCSLNSVSSWLSTLPAGMANNIPFKTAGASSENRLGKGKRASFIQWKGLVHTSSLTRFWLGLRVEVEVRHAVGMPTTNLVRAYSKYLLYPSIASWFRNSNPFFSVSDASSFSRFDFYQCHTDNHLQNLSTGIKPVSLPRGKIQESTIQMSDLELIPRKPSGELKGPWQFSEAMVLFYTL